MKSNKIYLLAIGLILVFSSCKKSFTDLKPYNALPLPDALNSEAGLNTAVNGMYASLRSANLYGRTMPLKGDLMADNLYIKASNSGRYLDFNDYNITVSNANAAAVWQSSYVAIKNINTIVNSPLTANTNINQFRGEAYALRALMHFELVRNYAKPYTVDPNALGVPIVTSFDQNALPTRNTLKQVYDQINNDLNQAVSLMTFNINATMTIAGTGQSRSLNSSYMTKWAARALQAKVYMTMGDWTNAKAAALDVVQNSGITMVTNAAYVNYFKSPTPRTDKVETLFEVSSDAVDNNGFNALSYFFDAAGYGDALVTNEFYGQFSATDVRRQLINPVVSGGFTVYYVTKYPNSSNATDRDDQKVLRFSDVLLILAESYARTNDEVNARIRLNQVAQSRDASFAGYNSTGAQLINDIIAERRKELAFEGDRFFDQLRTNVTVNKVRRENPTQLIVVDPNNFMRIFPIPQVELDVNPNIRSQQNPGY